MYAMILMEEFDVVMTELSRSRKCFFVVLGENAVIL